MIQGIYSTVKNIGLDFNCHGYKISQALTNCIFLRILCFFTEIHNTKIVKYSQIFT